jgi:hypothetical protein
MTSRGDSRAQDTEAPSQPAKKKAAGEALLAAAAAGSAAASGSALAAAAGCMGLCHRCRRFGLKDVDQAGRGGAVKRLSENLLLPCCLRWLRRKVRLLT